MVFFRYLLLLSFNFFPVVNQVYEAGILDEYVIRGNSAILKCSIPSFVADFVYITSWVDETGKEYLSGQSQDMGKL